jgi:hypothetical protein
MSNWWRRQVNNHFSSRRFFGSAEERLWRDFVPPYYLSYHDVFNWLLIRHPYFHQWFWTICNSYLLWY